MKGIVGCTNMISRLFWPFLETDSDQVTDSERVRLRVGEREGESEREREREREMQRDV